MKKGFTSALTTAIGLLIAFLVVGYYFGLPYINNQQYTKYANEALPIAEKLETEVRNFERRIFKNQSKYYTVDEGRRILEEKREDLTDIANDIDDLNDEFKSVDSSLFNKDTHFKLEQAFALADSAVKKYERSQSLREQINKFKDDQLEGEIRVFINTYSSEGDRLKFILQTQKIIDLTDDRTAKLLELEVTTDDRAYVDYQVDLLKEQKQLYTRINSYIRNDNSLLVENTIKNYQRTSYQTNDKLDKLIEDFTENSTIAKDLENFHDVIDEVEKDLREFTEN